MTSLSLQPDQSLHDAARSRMKIAIIGSGNIGTDLLVKVLRSPLLECVLFVGRSMGSRGIRMAQSFGVETSDRSVDALVEKTACYDFVFDATSASAHKVHWPILRRLGKTVVDLTPSRIGAPFVPAVDIQVNSSVQNVSLISCGGQASIPLAHLIGLVHEHVEYIEVVSSVAAKSAGPATRINIDEYIETTEWAIMRYSNSVRAKKILTINPAEPCVHMKTTISAKVRDPNLDALSRRLIEVVKRIKRYVPGYNVVVPPKLDNGRILISVRVTGLGDFLPPYAGNLDIINCAAIATAETCAQSFLQACDEPEVSGG